MLRKVYIADARAQQTFPTSHTAAVPGVGWPVVPHELSWFRTAAQLLSPGGTARQRACPSRVLRGQDQAGNFVPPEAVEGQAPLPIAWRSVYRPPHHWGTGQNCRSAEGALAAVSSGRREWSRHLEGDNRGHLNPLVRSWLPIALSDDGAAQQSRGRGESAMRHWAAKRYPPRYPLGHAR